MQNNSGLSPALDLKALLLWYVESGIDEVLGDAPICRWKEEASVSAAPAKIAEPASMPAPLPTPLIVAPSVAATAEELIREAAQAFQGAVIDLEIRPQAPIFILTNDLKPDQEMLAKMFQAIGYPVGAQSFFSLNASPPILSAPQRQWTETMLAAALKFAAPRLVICVGEKISRQILGYKKGWADLKERPLHSYAGSQIPTGFVFHPDFLVLNPRQKRQAWDDLQAIKGFLDA